MGDLLAAITRAGLAAPNPRDVTSRDCPQLGCTDKVDTDTVSVHVFRHMIGEGFTSLPRGDLASAIFETIDDKVESIFSGSITSVDDHVDGVRLTVENSPPCDFDLLVGADGLHSNVRRVVFGPEETFEHYLGCKVAACVVERVPATR